MDELCKERFEAIERRLEKGDGVLKAHTTDIAVLKTNMENLTKSLSALTKALWGVCGTALASLFGFFMWYIEKL
ncbi:MAG: hypothetical protein E7393_04800 [Ruminococcaceae bacterium]|nr:hypothetical protein [Oscillospiraceae bacterium]